MFCSTWRIFQFHVCKIINGCQGPSTHQIYVAYINILAWNFNSLKIWNDVVLYFPLFVFVIYIMFLEVKQNTCNQTTTTTTTKYYILLLINYYYYLYIKIYNHQDGVHFLPPLYSSQTIPTILNLRQIFSSYQYSPQSM